MHGDRIDGWWNQNPPLDSRASLGQKKEKEKDPFKWEEKEPLAVHELEVSLDRADAVIEGGACRIALHAGAGVHAEFILADRVYMARRASLRGQRLRALRFMHVSMAARAGRCAQRAVNGARHLGDFAGVASCALHPGSILRMGIILNLGVAGRAAQPAVHADGVLRR